MGQAATHMALTEPTDHPSSFSDLVALLPDAMHRGIHTEMRDNLELSDYILTRARVDLRRHINTRAPIYKLPPEMFSYIFEYVVQPNVDRTVKSHKPATARIPEMRALLTLSQVSSRWRAIALNTQSLWTHIDTRNEVTLEAFLACSQQKPLRLHMPTMIYGRTDMHRLLRQHGNRVRRLDFVETPAVGGRHPPIHLLRRLECLTVSSDCDWRPNEDHDETGWTGAISYLKALALQPYCSWMPGDFFPRLTHLHLSHFHERVRGQEAMDYLAILLRRTPALQFLQLSGLELESFFTSVSPPVPLHSLRALMCLESDMAAALRFLESLDLPEHALVRLDGLSRWQWNPPVAYFTRPLPSLGLVASFDHLEVVADETALHVVAQGERSGLWIRADSFHETPNSQDHWTEWVTSMGAMLSLASIRTLHICVLDPDLLPALLPLLPNLVELAVRIHPRFMGYDEGPCWSLLDCLYTTLTPGETSCCPALQTLAVEILTEDPDQFRLPGAPGRYDNMRTVLEMVAARSSVGKPLRRLAMQPYCDCPEGHVTMIETFRTALAPFEEYVAVVEVVESGKSVLCPLEMRGMWNVSGAEEYWDVAPGDRPEYRLPWDE
ncbi:uncharacterized protein TRAVEDRAFT_42687 [Trametes versicolor FP-101664 SS1]|uniref:uncharacterized protein n=1 Tax=Trametes versicolor (strain FP-101664) TaxID=717944 RepID=UPI0004624505|nr:uncharacterized protein TRAVEDRAFT_42687 [Trametes versicolor FP-101664 SS1]EIW65307.1 hypothetical protein TRAVEDRAFT_42687 [Trametes versicolor FP-101664 SS1]